MDITRSSPAPLRVVAVPPEPEPVDLTALPEPAELTALSEPADITALSQP
ncbi:prenyltransferase, partial [Streptomyces parvus]